MSLTVTDSVPTGISLDGMTISDDGVLTGGTITWTDITVGAQSEKELTFSGTVTASSGSEITNTAKISNADGSAVDVPSNTTTTDTYESTPVVIEVNLDDEPWDEPEVTLRPVGGDGSDDITDLTKVPDGDYEVIVDGEETGKTVTVNHDEPGGDTVTGDGLIIDYYTLNVTGDGGTDSPSGSGIYLKGAQADIGVGVINGYSFVDWTVTQGTVADVPVTADGKITIDGTTAIHATTEANEGIAFRVHHWVMNTSGVYELIVTDSLTGSTDQELTLSALKKGSLEIPGGIAYQNAEIGAGSENGATSAVETAIISADGALEVSLFYDRMKYNLTLKTDTGVEGITNGSDGSYYYGEQIPIEAAIEAGYDFSKWEADTGVGDNIAFNPGTVSMPPYDLTLTAKATPKPIDHTPTNPPDPDEPISREDPPDFTFPGDIENLEKIVVDGEEKELRGPNADGSYDIYDPDGTPMGSARSDGSGNVVVTLDEAYMSKLADGKHTLETVFNDNGVISSGSLQFTVTTPAPGVDNDPVDPPEPKPEPKSKPPKPKPQKPRLPKTSGSPKTGVELDSLPFMLLAVLALTGCGLCGIKVYKYVRGGARRGE